MEDISGLAVKVEKKIRLKRELKVKVGI